MSGHAGAGVPGLRALQAFVDASPAATLMFGLPDQRVQVANEAAAALIGSPQSAIVGRRPAQVWDVADARRSRAALSGLAIGAFDSYRARRTLRTSCGLVPVSVWARRVHVVDGSVAMVIVVPDTETTVEARTVGAFVLAETAADAAVGPNPERMAVLERHLLRFADELHAGGWRDAKPSAVHASRFAALDELPPRQREIVDRLLRGQRIAPIAASMYISASTARNHLSRVFATFGVHSQSELLALLRSGPSAVEDADAENRP